MPCLDDLTYSIMMKPNRKGLTNRAGESMGQEPEKLKSSKSELEAFALTFTGRLAQVLSTPENGPASSGKQLEELLRSIPAVPWLKKIAADLLSKLDALSDEKWRNKLIDFCEQWANSISNYYISRGEGDPLKKSTPVEKARFIARIFGRSKLRWFISDMRRFCRETLERFSKGELGNNILVEITNGLFTKDLASSLEQMNLMFYLSGGKTLVEQVEEAAQYVKGQMDSQMALVAAMEIAEKQHKWVVNGEEVGFDKFWTSIKPRLIRAIDNHMLELPGTRLISEIGPYPEEMLFLQESVFEELLKRMRNDPLAVFQDATEGRLHNSLVVAITNDLRDRIKYLRAIKRDIKNEEFGDQEKHKEKNQDTIDPEVQVRERPDQYFGSDNDSDQLTDIYFEEMIANLDNDEKQVLTMLFKDGLLEKEIAKELHKSPAWVTQTKHQALKKLSEEISNNTDNL
jgi:RNA polymerase sigma factor (sigma-70 family)